MFPSNNRRPVRSTRVSSTSGRRFFAFRLCGNQGRCWHIQGRMSVCITCPMKFRRYFTNVCGMAFCNSAVMNAINSFHSMFPSEKGFAIFNAASYSHVIAYSIFYISLYFFRSHKNKFRKFPTVARLFAVVAEIIADSLMMINGAGIISDIFYRLWFLRRIEPFYYPSGMYGPVR